MSADAASEQPPFQVFGDPDARIIVGGHSHTASMILAINEGLIDAKADRVGVAFTSDWFPPTTDAYWEWLTEQSVGRAVGLLWSGNEHNGRFLLQQRPPFRVFDPETPEDQLPGPDQGAWVPRSELAALWLPTFDGLRRALTALTSVADVYVLSTPAPKSDRVVRAALATEPAFLEQARTLGYSASDLQITPEVTRVTLWRILRDLLRDTAEAAGAVFVPVPGDTIDARGLLLDEYDAGDVTHANGAYGAQAWRHLLRAAALEVAR